MEPILLHGASMNWSFSKKLYAAFSFLALGSTAGSLLYFYVQTKDLVLEQMGNRLKDVGKTAVHLFTVEDLKALREVRAAVDREMGAAGLVLAPIQPGEYREVLPAATAERLMAGKEFQALVSVLRKIKSATATVTDGVEHPTLAYATILSTVPASPTHEVLQFLADADYDKEDAPNPVGNLFHVNSEAIRTAFDGSVSADTDFRLEQGEHLFSAAVPIRDDEGKVAAVLALDFAAESEANKVKKLARLCLWIVSASVLLSVLFAWILTRLLQRPLNKLRVGAEQVAKRDYDTFIDLRTKDELGMLAAAFNAMVSEIRNYASGLEELNGAYERFVPNEFLEQLGQGDITKVKLGNQIQKQMTVLFSDIRSFTTISESMSPRDNFDFINDYLKAVSPVIRAHGGFIDKYIGDAVMALFPESVENAVKAAVAMQNVVKEFNIKGQEIGRMPIQIGIGLHNGNLMLGTVGEDQRMDGTVISDAVNLASRLESTTKEYGAGIIISERIMQTIAEKNAHHSRYLGQVTVKGKKQSVKIYEIIDGEDDDMARRKIITKPDFERAVRAVERNEVLKARRLLRKVLHLNRKDTAARMYLERLTKMQKQLAASDLEEERKKVITVAGESKIKA